MQRCLSSPPLLMALLLLAGIVVVAVAPPAGRAQNVPYNSWSDPIKAGACNRMEAAPPLEIPVAGGAPITCELVGGVKRYRFPAGVYEIDSQMLVPESTSITGAAGPNDMANPTRSPDWAGQTLFLATRGATDYAMNYCHAKDMVTTRVGFVLSSYVTVRNVSYQGIDTIRCAEISKLPIRPLAPILPPRLGRGLALPLHHAEVLARLLPAPHHALQLHSTAPSTSLAAAARCPSRSPLTAARTTPRTASFTVHCGSHRSVPRVRSTSLAAHGVSACDTRRRLAEHRPGQNGALCGGASRRRDCHFADALSPSLLIHLLKAEGGAAE